MKKQIFSFLLAGMMIVGLSTFASSCSNDHCTTPTETAIVDNQDGVNFDAVYASIFPSDNDVISQDGPPTRGGGPGSRDTVRGGGPGKRDTVRGGGTGRDTVSRPMPWQSVLPCLKLTVEQATKLRELSKAQIDCEKAARDQFRTILDPLRKAQQAEMNAIRADVKAGTITREEAAARIKALNDRMRAATQEAEAQVRAALKSCMDTFFAGIEAMLTPEQLTLWMQWKTTGQSPCPKSPIGRP